MEFFPYLFRIACPDFVRPVIIVVRREIGLSYTGVMSMEAPVSVIDVQCFR